MSKTSNIGKGRELLDTGQKDMTKTGFLDQLYKDCQKDFNTMERVSDGDTDLWLPTGNAALDFVLSDKTKGGGYPFGRVIEIYGDTTTGKSMLGLLALIQTIHHQGGAGLLQDVENAVVAKFYRMLGGDPRYLFVDCPLHITSVYDNTCRFIEKVRAKSKEMPLLVVYDSLPISRSKVEFDLSKDDKPSREDMGRRAKEHSDGLRKIVPLIKGTPTIFIIINSLMATFAQFGPDQETRGGTGPKLWSSIRIHLMKGKKLYLRGGGTVGEYDKNKAGGKAQGEMVGIRGRLQVEKSRYTPPFREISFDILYRGGIHPYSGWFGALSQHSKAFQEAVTKGEGKVRAGYYVPAGTKPDDPDYTAKTFTANTFMQRLPEMPELLAAYPFDPKFGLPDDESLVAVDFAEGEKEDSVGEDGGSYEAEPTNAEEV